MAMITNASSKYNDLILKSALIKSGSPAVFQLRPKREYIGTLTKMTMGEKNVTKLNKTILLVGETGAGISTLINALVNYAIGVRWEDDIWFHIVEEEKKSQSESQTTDVIVYQIFDFEGQTLPFSLTIIDTPGYGSTRGIEHDVIVSERLLDLFRSEGGVYEIHAVGLVMKASDNRLTDRLRYIFDSTESLFSKNIERNIVALITHSDGVTPENVLKALEAAEIKCARDEEENEPVHFLFNNCQTKERTKKNKIPLKSAWDLTADQMSQFTEFLEKTEPQTLKTTAAVLKKPIRLTACIRNLKERIDFIELKQREIKQIQEALKKHEQEMKNSETLNHIKTRYKAESESKQNQLEELQRKMEELQRDKDRWLNEAFQHVVTLEKIALNSVSTYVHLDFLIEKMKERGDTEKVQKLEEMKRRVETDEGFGAAVQYVFGKLSSAGKAVKGMMSKMHL